jgi:hypothetical protein
MPDCSYIQVCDPALVDDGACCGAMWAEYQTEEGAMPVQEMTGLVGEVHCLNCGRVLANVVRASEQGGFRLRPAMGQSTVQVKIPSPGLLRCGRCNGRAFVEPLEEPAEERATRARGVSSLVA